MEQLLRALYAAGHKSFDLAIERLIALLRVALAFFCFIVLMTKPGLQPQFKDPFALIPAVYALFGLAVALLPTIGRLRTGWQLPVHIVDIGIISILIDFIYKFSPTFFVLYVFVLLSATYRWNWRGALSTTAALLVVHVILYSSDNRSVSFFIIQCAFLAIVGGVFVFFGISRERSAERLTRIAAWPGVRWQSDTEIERHWLDASLQHIATVFESPRVLVIWEILQEPYSVEIYLANGECHQKRAVAIAFGNLVSEELENITFACAAADSNECLTSIGTKHCVGTVLSQSLRARYKIASACSAPFSGDFCRGRLFVLDRPDWRDDDLALAEIAASRLSVELEYYAVCIQLEETAAGRERIRMARDLHDGVLQSLTAAGLQLSLIGSKSGKKVEQKLEGIRKMLLAEQQRLRAFVQGQQPSVRPEHLTLFDELKREREEIERQWGCNVQLSVVPQDASVPSKLMRQIELLLAEAVANAIQHGNASRIDIMAECTPDHIKLRIANNGLGLKGVTGAYSQDELNIRGIGPRSISKRVAELGGSLTVSSSSNGVELHIALPFNERTMINANEKTFAHS